MGTASLLLQYGLQALRTTVEIGILAFLIYSVLLFLRGTRAATVLAGITVLGLVLSVVARYLGLQVIDWLLMKMWAIFAISILVIFQPEIRRAFAEFGSRQGQLFAGGRRQQEIVTELLDTAFILASRKIGALIALEGDIGMRAIAETGTLIDARISRELLIALFYPNSPLHDGGVIIRGERIMAGGCIFPLTQNPQFGRELGTRHRAGVGVTEETDAVTIIVSEESGKVSLAYLGRLVKGVDRPRLERHLSNYLGRSTPATVRNRLENLREQLSKPVQPSDKKAGP